MAPRFTSKDTGGFTLIEVLVALAILSILVSVAVPSYQRSIFRARQAEGYVVIGNAKINQWAYFGSYDCFANTEIQPMGMVGTSPLQWTSMAVGFSSPCDGGDRTLKDLGVEPSKGTSYYQYQCGARVPSGVIMTHEFVCSGLADLDGDTMNNELLFCTDQAAAGMGLPSRLTMATCLFPYSIYRVSVGNF